MKHSFFGRNNRARQRRDVRSTRTHQRARRSLLERLEDRHLLTGMPYGALPDDTAEYMLGDVYVNVVLMESDSSLAPFDQSTENWTTSEIADVKNRIATGLEWWEDTLDALQDVRDGLLKFTLDFTHADAPVHTGYEPIKRTSQEFSSWVYDFLDSVGFAQSGNFLTDLRAYNNAQRLAHNANWSFTIFVVDDSHDLATDFNDNPLDSIPDYDGTGRFGPGSAFNRSFAYAGGNAFVMPGDRPASIVAHETGHMFWALDEYNTGNTAYLLKRGYYNTQNTNSTSNPGQTTQADSIMSSGTKLDAAYAAHTSSIPSLEMIGWKDSDDDGIFDVLDVPFSLDGTGEYTTASSTFRFVGKSQVRTLPNQNSSGLKSDITINQIDRAEYSIDGGDWITAGTYHQYVVDLDLSISVSPGASQIRIRTIDDRTGVTSKEYVASLGQNHELPQTSPQPGISGYVFADIDGGGTWDGFEDGLPGWLVQLINNAGQPIDLRRLIDPEDYIFGALLNYVASPELTLSATGGDVADANVYARTSTSVPGGGKVLFNNGITDSMPVDTWSVGRQLRIDFSPAVTAVNITAISNGAPSVGRLEIYDSSNQLLERYTTGVLSSGQSELMKVVRPQGDIAYALAFGHAGTEVLLDTLEWGANSSTVTDQFGYYSLPEVPSGLYRVAAVPRRYYALASPSTSFHQVQLLDPLAGAADLNFGYLELHGPWNNPSNPLDVNADGKVSAADSLAGINYINTHALNVPLPETRPPGEKYYDVNNDGYVSAVDVLMVINELNRAPASLQVSGEGSGSGSRGSLRGGGSSASPSGEGDPQAQPLVPGAGLAAQYYSRNPLQVLEVPGSADTCHCDQCTTITEVASGRVNAAAKTVVVPPAILPLEERSFAAAKKDALLLNRYREALPHLDVSLLNTLAAVVTQGEDAKPGRRGRR